MLEAAPVSSEIQPLPTSMEYLEGFMHLRNDPISIINMKRRLGLDTFGSPIEVMPKK